LRVVEFLCVATILIAFVGFVLKRNLLMKILCLDVMTTGVVSLFVVLSRRFGERVPIVSEGVESYAHPVPQAAIVTAIVIGFATLSLSVTVTMILVQRLQTVDTVEIEKKARG